MSDNYPPGVTGLEDYFGPDAEREERLWCFLCDAVTDHVVRTYRGRGLRIQAECRECETETELTDGPDE